MKSTYYAVVSESDTIVQCMDGGKSLPHVALWLTRGEAERFMQGMILRCPGGQGGISYKIVEVTVCKHSTNS